MSIKLMTMAWELRLDPAEKLVLLKLADWVNEERDRAICWPSIGKLASLTNVSDTTVKRAIRSLEAAGHITRELREGETTRYLVHPKMEGGVNLTRVTHDPPGGSPTTPNTKGKQNTSRAKALSVLRATSFPEGDDYQYRAVEWARVQMGWPLSDANAEFNRFKDSAEAHGRTYKSWEAAWRTWCRSPYCKTVSPQAAAATYRSEPLRV